MPLTSTDWLVIIGYLLANLLIGVYYRRRASGNTEEFFISGRDVSWWLAGTSMVATTFAADTPLLVTGLVARQGIAGNWIWWGSCVGGMLTVFFFARYWRRAEILTDVQLVEIRYGGKPAAFLRGFKSIYLGLFMNCFILGWVTQAMVNIITVLLGPAIAQGRVVNFAGLTYTLGDPKSTALIICVFVLIPFTGLYTFIGGLWGVLVTDLFQFALKMTMIIVLAWVAVAKIGGMGALKTQLHVVAESTRASGTEISDPTNVSAGFSSGPDDQRPVDAAGADLHCVPGHAVVAGVVSGSGAGRRRIRGATHVQRERREEFAGRNALVQHRPLRVTAMALGRDRSGGAGRLLAAWRPPSERGFRGESRARVRNGAARLPASSAARADGGGVPGGIHVDHRNAVELGKLVPGKRSLQALLREGRHRETLRNDQQNFYSLPRAGQRLHGDASWRRSTRDGSWC